MFFSQITHTHSHTQKHKFFFFNNIEGNTMVPIVQLVINYCVFSKHMTGIPSKATKNIILDNTLTHTISIGETQLLRIFHMAGITSKATQCYQNFISENRHNVHCRMTILTCLSNLPNKQHNLFTMSSSGWPGHQQPWVIVGLGYPAPADLDCLEPGFFSHLNLPSQRSSVQPYS